MKPLITLIVLVLVIQFCPVSGHAIEVDAQLMDSLKTEANHDQTRRNQFKDDRNAKKVFSNEREKGLGAFLEEQEKWDLIRERGLGDHRKQKQSKSPVEGGPEYVEDQRLKKIEQQKMEQAQKLTVQTREQIVSKRSSHFAHDELEELNLLDKRPRFEIRKRGQNKWVKNGASGNKSSGSSGGASGGGYSPPPPAFDDYPIQPDYMPAPAPIEGFEEIPPPPPVNYDGSGGAINGFPYNGNIDSGFGEPPPPPPPPPIFDDMN